MPRYTMMPTWPHKMLAGTRLAVDVCVHSMMLLLRLVLLVAMRVGAVDKGLLCKAIAVEHGVAVAMDVACG